MGAALRLYCGRDQSMQSPAGFAIIPAPVLARPKPKRSHDPNTPGTLPSNAKVLYAILADETRLEGLRDRTHVSIGRLVDLSGFARRTVQVALRALVREGIIARYRDPHVPLCPWVTEILIDQRGGARMYKRPESRTPISQTQTAPPPAVLHSDQPLRIAHSSAPQRALECATSNTIQRELESSSSGPMMTEVLSANAALHASATAMFPEVGHAERPWDFARAVELYGPTIVALVIERARSLRLTRPKTAPATFGWVLEAARREALKTSKKAAAPPVAPSITPPAFDEPAIGSIAAAAMLRQALAGRLRLPAQ
jgi:hypothetical protein